MEVFLALFVPAVLFFIYFMPTLVAHLRRHRNEDAIFVLNLFLAWTLLGWVLALAWSATKNVAPSGGAAMKKPIAGEPFKKVKTMVRWRVLLFAGMFGVYMLIFGPLFLFTLHDPNI